MSESSARLESGPIVVGIKSGLPRAIVEAAASAAKAFGCELVFAFAEFDAAMVELEMMPMRPAVSLHPDLDEEMSEFAARLRGSLEAALEGSTVTWSFRIIAGDPANALVLLADELGARMLIVGTRRPGPMHFLEELFSGSVGKRLAMAQRCPVLLVPMGTTNKEQAPPTE